MGPFIFLDIETTGFDPNRNQIIEVAALKWADFKIIKRFESLVNPHTKLPQEISQLTGINDTMLAGAPRFADIKDNLFRFIDTLTIIGHNIAFDMAFLKSHHTELKNPEIDTLSLARILLRKESSYALEVLMKKYGLPLRESHRAMADTETTVSFFEFLLGKIREIPSHLWPKLDALLKKSNWAGREIFSMELFTYERCDSKISPG